MRPTVILLLIVLAASMILIPTFLVLVLNDDQTKAKSNEKNVDLEVDPTKSVQVKVYRSNLDKIETYNLEEYVRGVVAAEMPINFEIEALKAQAIAARTYIVKKIIDKNYSDVPSGAMVTDTVKHQVFLSEEELKRQWGLNYEENISKLNNAVNQTNGQVITYNGKPIDALYFSTSNGYTENSEDYWEKEVPYLRSVASPWDLDSPKYNDTTFVPFSEIESVLKIDTAVISTSGQEWIKILGTTTGKRVKEIKIGDRILTGREVRTLFKLDSSSFTWELKADGIQFYTKGYGHGVGMSQYGANGMAKEGTKAIDIIKHYYTDVSITSIENWIKINN